MLPSITQKFIQDPIFAKLFSACSAPNCHKWPWEGGEPAVPHKNLSTFTCASTSRRRVAAKVGRKSATTAATASPSHASGRLHEVRCVEWQLNSKHNPCCAQTISFPAGGDPDGSHVFFIYSVETKQKATRQMPVFQFCRPLKSLIKKQPNSAEILKKTGESCNKRAKPSRGNTLRTSFMSGKQENLCIAIATLFEESLHETTVSCSGNLAFIASVSFCVLR